MKTSAAVVPVLVVGLLFIAWLAWLAGPSHGLLTSQYTRALAVGHAYLGVPPDPALLALKDPYDPATNQAYRVVDASLFKGRYYLYFGVVPFVTVLVPWFRLTGHELPDSYLSAAYCWGAMVCLAIVLAHVARLYFPRAGWISLTTAILVAALAGGGLILIRDPNIYQVVIAGAYFHEFIALLAYYFALHNARGARRWLAFAGLNTGLAVGCRPSHVIVAGILTVFIIWAWAALEKGKPGKWWRLVWILTPLSVLAASIAWYNWFRFGSPFDFGYLHALVNSTAFRSSSFGLVFVPFNLWVYLLGWPRLSPWFPFFEGSGGALFKLPPNYYLGQIYGVILVAPFVLLGGVILAKLRSVRPPLRTFVVLVSTIALINLLFLSTIDGGNTRYIVDFLPYVMIAAGIGLLDVAEKRFGSLGWHLVLQGAFGLALFSLLTSFCASFAYSGLARIANPGVFESVGRVFNQPRFLWDRWHQTPLRAFRVHTILPKNKFGFQEPLLVVGRQSEQDFIYLYYVAPGYIRIGYEAIGSGGPVSDLIPVDYGKAAVIDLELGFLWPPPGAPQYSGLTDREVQTLRRRLIVKINGLPALDGWVMYHQNYDVFHWGSSPDDNAFGTRYTGTPLAVTEFSLSRAAFAAENRPDAFGPVEFELIEDSGVVGTMPLVSIGYSARWQLLALVNESEGRARLVFRGSGSSTGCASALLDWPPRARHRLVLSAGGLYPPEASDLWGGIPLLRRRQLRRSVRIELDGKVLASAESAAPETGPTSVVIGRNSLLASGVQGRFPGSIKQIGRRDIVAQSRDEEIGRK